jgi:competence protein ComEC
MKKFHTFILLFLAAVILDGYLWVSIAKDLQVHAPLTLDFLDIGQGDAQLLTLPGGARIMIDSGPPGGRVADKLDKVIGKTDGYIDLAIITHPELDHFGGYAEVLKRYRVGAVLMTGREKDTSEWKHFAAQLRASGIPIVLVKEGDTIQYGASHIDIISPGPEFFGSDALNDTGIVTKLQSTGVTALFTADIGQNVEDYLLPRYNLDVDILKVGHHGSKFSSSEEFLNEVTPKVAVIQVGAHNTYGHPTPQTLSRLKAIGAKIYRNDLDHTVELTVIGGKIYETSI